ncbi:MAG: hypothetical protein ABS53_07535 [Hydrogenophaga sp. SCN 70-13]|nr:MAG: hypothetical protein ABS53_07535 [Hydrogenophaga sp. SCN 70-13]
MPILRRHHDPAHFAAVWGDDVLWQCRSIKQTFESCHAVPTRHKAQGGHETAIALIGQDGANLVAHVFERRKTKAQVVLDADR